VRTLRLMLFGCFGSAGSTEKSVGPEAFGTRIMSSKKLSDNGTLGVLGLYRCVICARTRQTEPMDA